MENQACEMTSPVSFIPQPPKYKRVSSSSSIVSKTRRPVSGNSVKFKTENGEILKPISNSDDNVGDEKTYNTAVTEDSPKSKIGLKNKSQTNHYSVSKCTEDERGISDKTISSPLKSGINPTTEASDVDQTSHVECLESGKSSKCSNFEDSISDHIPDSQKEESAGLQFRHFRRSTVSPELASNDAVENNMGPENFDSANSRNGLDMEHLNKDRNSDIATSGNTSNVNTKEKSTETILSETVESVDARKENVPTSGSKESPINEFEEDANRNDLKDSKRTESNNPKISWSKHIEEEQTDSELKAPSSDSKVNIISNMQSEKSIDMHNNSEDSKYSSGDEKTHARNGRANSNTQGKQISTLRHQKNDDVIEVIDNEPSTSTSENTGPNPIEVAIWMKRRAMMRRKKKRRIYTTDIYETDGQMSNQGYMDKPQGEAAEKRKARNQMLKRRLSLAAADIGDGKTVTQIEVKYDSTAENKKSEVTLETTTDEKSKADVTGEESEEPRLSDREPTEETSEDKEGLGESDMKMCSETDVRESDMVGTNHNDVDSEKINHSDGNQSTEEDEVMEDKQTGDESSTQVHCEDHVEQVNKHQTDIADSKEEGTENNNPNRNDASTDRSKSDDIADAGHTYNEVPHGQEDKSKENYAKDDETDETRKVSDNQTESRVNENNQTVKEDKAIDSDHVNAVEQQNDVDCKNENFPPRDEEASASGRKNGGSEGRKQKYGKKSTKRQKTANGHKENRDGVQDKREAKSKSKVVVSRLEMSSSDMDSALLERKAKMKSKKKSRHKSKKKLVLDEMASSSEVEGHEELSHYKQRSLKDLCKELRLVRRAISELYDESKKRKRKELKTETVKVTNTAKESKSDESINQNEPVRSNKEDDRINASDIADKINNNIEGENHVIDVNKEDHQDCQENNVSEKDDGHKEHEFESHKDEKDAGPNGERNSPSTLENKEVLDASKDDMTHDTKCVTQDEETGINNSDDINERSVDSPMHASTETQCESIEGPTTQGENNMEENDEKYDSFEERDDREDDCSLHVSRCESVNLHVEGRQGTRVTESDMDSVVWKDDDFPELRSSTSDETISIVKDIVDDLVKRVCDFPDHRTHKKELRTKKENQDEIFCIVYCDIRIPGFAAFADSLSCIEEDLMTYSNMVPKYGHLLSPVISLLSSLDSVVPDQFTVRVPFMKASMRHYQTPVLRTLSPENTWQDIQSEEYMYEDDDGCIIPVLEAEIGTLAPMAVVAMPIIETFIFDGNVREMCSCVDPGIVISSSFSPRFNSVETIINLTVLPISTDVIDDSRYSRAEDAQLLASTSSLIKVDLMNDPPQAVTLYLPCEKPKSRPWTAQMSSRLSTDSGFLSASRIKSRAKSREAINNFLELWYEAAIYLVRIANGNLAAKETRLKNRDVTRDEKVVLTCHEKTSTFLIVETKKEAQHPNVNSIANNLLYYIETQRVVLCILQKKDNPRQVTILCDLKSRLTSRMQLRYEREHHIRRAVFSIKEGDLVRLSLRGNIANVRNEVLVTRFYAIHGIKVDWDINVVDIYSQRSLPSFCGFVQLHSWNPDESMAADTEVTSDDGESWSRVIDVPITLPKYKTTISPSLIKVPLHLRNEGPISVDFLMSLAKYIGYEWYHLARALHIDHARVQSIVQQNRHQITQKLVSDLLLTWMKRSPHGVDKAHVLVKALRRCGRSDLADEIKDIDKTYKKDLHRISYEKRLSKAIETTASSPVVVHQWRRLSHVLGVREKTIASISSTGYDDKRKCMAMLAEWRKSTRHRSHKKLVGSLRQIGCNCVADHLISTVVLRPKTSF